VPSTFNVVDGSLTQLLEKLHTAQTQYDKLSKTTAENNPILSSIQAEITKTKADIQDNISSQKKNIKASQGNLDQITSKYNSMASMIPQKERELVEVSRQRNTKADIYSFLLQKREETAYSINSTLPDSILVDSPSTGSSPVSPKPMLIMAISLLLPLALGFGIVSIKDSLKNNILFRSDIEKLTDYPVIGEVIHEDFEDPLVTNISNRSYIVEQFRLIRSAIKNLNPGNAPVKSMIVTSSIEGEGKSFIAANIEMMHARSGKKTVIVELDLHQPKLCESFGMERKQGITDFLRGEAKETDIIKATAAHAHLSLVSAGQRPDMDEISELLLNGRIDKLIATLRGQFDMVILDTAPINPISDYFTLAPLCDLTLYIVRHGKTPKSFIQHLPETMASHNVDHVAIIFNDVKKRGIGKYGYGYGYGYGYNFKSSYDSYNKQNLKKVS
jgi:capsular exopolysaccharide synthesis family protein